MRFLPFGRNDQWLNPVLLGYNQLLDQKLADIHNHPADSERADEPFSYRYRLARGYSAQKGLLAVGQHELC
ncbi:MAG: hypothetical protein ABJH98_12655 [Reichenbachiella sp.]|uniref:hypothetical protein n=1 Tax=Reichenbachiella sp. TaxID=2184521 RepID=UPI00329838B9